ncbi:hypothetical protein QZH41_008560 [Actinostola sp. cb2023]|nr:hypothetical protein QZH41_008560 [Actinostola sp. cb2023]
MAAVFNTQQVIDELFKDYEEDDEEEEEELEEEDKDRDKLRELLETYDSEEGFDKEFFVAKTLEVALPIVKQATSETRTDAAHLATSTVSAASVLHDEGTLWLSLVYKRLAGRVSVRYPYQAELTRNIPFAIFKEITLMLRRSTSPEFQEPHCIIGKNKKGEVISFTCLGSLLKLFQLLTGMSSRKVRNYFTRVLNGSSRGGHRVKLIVSDNKDFAFCLQVQDWPIEHPIQIW